MKMTPQKAQVTRHKSHKKKFFVLYVVLLVLFVIIKSLVQFLLACEPLLVACVARHVRLEHLVEYELIFLNSCYFAHPLKRKQGSAATRRLGSPAEQQSPPQNISDDLQPHRRRSQCIPRRRNRRGRGSIGKRACN